MTENNLVTTVDEKAYSSLVDLIRDSEETKSVAGDLEKRIAKRRIIKQLMALRSCKGISQKQLAASLNCSQSRISKLESGDDHDLRLGDLDAYLDALGLDLRLLVTKKGSTIADLIKYHWQCLGRLLDSLLDLARNDAEIAVGVAKFSKEIAFNYSTSILAFMKQLPAHSRNKSEPLSIEVEEIDFEIEPDCEEHHNPPAAASP